ncbi:PRC-barrel domain containing protein [Streptomyces uncialis]|uniref:PRC-barrel domain containing protein n=1 Tax=Streptomyces uncialis TaxID=1048205 RepID=UPI0033C48C55
MSIQNIWSYTPLSGHTDALDLTGFTVEATDGTIGHVDRQADGRGTPHLVVDTGVWKFGKSVLVPAGIVTGVDAAEQRVTLSCTRDEVKSAPLFRTDSETLDPAYLAEVGGYYHALPTRRPD